jgi:hypothetical protein
VRHLVGGFGWLFGLGVVALVARYGYISSDNEVNGAILAFLFAGVAAGGLFGHAVAVRIWRIHRGWSFVLGLICVAALVLNISNSLGAIAGRDDKTLAERTKVKETRAGDQAELKRLTGEHAALPKFVATTPEAVKAAREAVASSERIRAAECEKRGTRCRERENEEQAKRDALATILTNRALTERAERLETDMKRLRERLDKGDVVRAVNPQGAILTKLFKLPDSEADTAATWQQFAMSIVVDLLIMGCFIAHEVMGWESRDPMTKRAHDDGKFIEPSATQRKDGPAIEPLALVEESSAAMIAAPRRPHLATSGQRRAGSVTQIMAETLEPARGKRAELEDVFRAYVAACRARGLDFVTPEQFIDPLQRFCRECGIATQTRAGKIYLMGVRLACSATNTAAGEQTA